MDVNKNSYTFGFAAIMVIIVAALLSSAAIGLKPFQDRNIELEKKQNILSSVGIVTDRDYATKIVAHNLPSDTSVETIMSSPLITINYDESISAAAQRMTTKKIRKLAVTNDGNIIGLITSTDLVTQLAK